MNKVTILKPTRDMIENLQVGDLALDCWGKMSKVTEIFGRGNDVNGKAYVCFFTEYGPTSKISGSYKEGEIVRTLAVTRIFNSARVRAMEDLLEPGTYESDLAGDFIS